MLPHVIALAQDAPYAIGAVSALTGLSPSTIRTWERRYGVVVPRRTASGSRRYSDQDIERLQLIKRLTDHGIAIGTAIGMDASQVEERLGELSERPSLRRAAPRMALLHPELAVRLKEAGSPWELVWQGSSVDELDACLEQECDLLIASLDALGECPGETLDRVLDAVGAPDAFVLYHYGTSSVLDTLNQLGARLLQEPVSLEQLEERVAQHLSLRSVRGEPATDNPAPRYDSSELARLREIQTTIDCECPRNLATLLTSVLAFEEYSARCRHKSPSDAQLHDALYRRTGLARIELEDMLQRVLLHEGIRL